MPALIDLLDQYLFFDEPGLYARAALKRAWEQASGASWQELYLQSLDNALAEELPDLSAHPGDSSWRPSREELAQVLATQLSDSVDLLQNFGTTSGGFLTELARAMQAKQLFRVENQNLYTDEYRQILLSLFDHAHLLFKSAITAHEPEFSAALADATGHDPLLNQAIAHFLGRQFGVTLGTRASSAAQAPSSTVAGTQPTSTPAAEEVGSAEPLSIPAFPPIPPSLGELRMPSPPPPPPPPAAPIPRDAQNHLRVLLATPSDVLEERGILERVVADLDERTRSRFNLRLDLLAPAEDEIPPGHSPVELADIFLGVLWLHFGKQSVETDERGSQYLAGTERDYAIALQQQQISRAALPRAVIYRSIRPPVDLLHFNVADYAQVQQFFERQATGTGDDWVHVYASSEELANDARARLEAWVANFAEELAGALSEYGRQFAAQGKIGDALQALQQATSLYRELDQPENELEDWLQVGTLLRAAGDNAAAHDAFEAALELGRRANRSDAAGLSWYQLGLIAADNDDWRAAIQSFDEARALFATDHPTSRAILVSQTNAYERLGDSQRATSEIEQARDAYRNALALAEMVDDKPRVSGLWYKLGLIAAQREEWNDAVQAYENATRFSELPASDPHRRAIAGSQSDAYAALALHAEQSGDDTTAAQRYQQALAALELGSDDRTKRARYLGALAAIANRRHEWREAIRAYDQALARLDAPEDMELRRSLLAAEAQSYKQLGNAYFNEQAWEDAGSAFRDELALYQELEDREHQGDVLYRLGTVSAQQARWQEANAYYAHALSRVDPATSREFRDRTLRQQADVLQKMGDQHRDAEEWAQAEIAYVQARGTLEQLGLSGETAEILTNLGIVTSAQGRSQEAIAYLQQARSKYNLPEQAPERSQVMRLEADTHVRVGDLRRAAGEAAQAEASYQQALDLAQELDDDLLQAVILHNRGLVAADQERWDDAVDIYDRALAHVSEAADENLYRTLERDQLFAYLQLGARARSAKLYPQADIAYRSALALSQQLDNREQEADLLHTLGVLAIEQENWDEALVNLRRSLGIYNLLPSASAKPQVIWDIGRAQRGQRRKSMFDALDKGDAALAAGDLVAAAAAFEDALDAAQALGDTEVQVKTRIQLGDIRRAQADWDSALEFYKAASAGLTVEDHEGQERIHRGQLDAFQQRSARAQNAGDWALAESDLTRALELAVELQDRKSQGDLTFRRGQLAADQHNWEQAIALYSDAINLLPETDPQRAEIERAQARAYQHLGDAERAGQNWAGADAAYSQALALYRVVNDRPAQVVVLSALAATSSPQERWSDSVTYLSQARDLALQHEQEFTPDQIQHLETELAHATRAFRRKQQATTEAEGDTRRAAHDWAAARSAYLESLEWAEVLEDSASRAELLAKLGFVASESGALDEALARYREAAAVSDTPEQAAQRAAFIELQAQTLQELGSRAAAASDWQAALSAYQSAVALLDSPEQAQQRSQAVRLQTVALQNLGDAARSRQDWAQALDCYRRAEGLAALLDDAEATRSNRLLEAEMLRNLARAQRAQNQFEEALDLYQHAAALYAENAAPDRLDALQRERIIAFSEAGAAFAAAQRWDQAVKAYRNGLQLARDANDGYAEANILYRLGDIQVSQQHWQEALPLFEQALERASRPVITDLYTTILLAKQSAATRMGDELRVAGKLEEAKEGYHTALAAAVERNAQEDAGQLYFILGTLAADSGQWAQAIANYDNALNQFEAGNLQEHQRDVKSYQAFAWQQLGDRQGQTDAARQSFNAALTLAHEIGDDLRAGQVLYRIGLLASAEGKWQDALAALQSAEALVAAEDDQDTLALVRDQANAVRRELTRLELAAVAEHARQADAARQWEDAATAYRRAQALASELGDSRLAADYRHALIAVHVSQATALAELELWEEALVAYHQALELAEGNPDQPDIAALRGNLLHLSLVRATSLRAAQDWRNAPAAYRQAIAVASELDDRDAVQARQAELIALGAAESAAYRQVQDWENAQAAYRRAIALAVEFNASDSVRALESELVALAAEESAAYRQVEDWENARAAYRRAMGIAAEFGDSDSVRRFQSELIALAAQQSAGYRSARDWENAQAAYRHAMGLAVEFGDSDSLRAFQSNLVELAAQQSAVYRSAQDWENAERAVRSQLAHAEEFDLKLAQADALEALATLQAERGQHQDAIDTLSTAAVRLESLEQSARIAAVHAEINRLTRIIQRQQLSEARTRADIAAGSLNWDEAKANYERAIDLARELKDGHTEAQLWLALARASELQFKPDAALDAYTNAINLLGAPAHADLATEARTARLTLLVKTGAAQVEQEQWDAAREAYSKAVPDAQVLGHTAELQMLYRQLGGIATRQQQYADSLGFYDRALELVPDPERNEILVTQAALWHALGDQQSDAGEYDQAQASYEHGLALARQLAQSDREAELLHSLGLVHALQGNWIAAAKSHRAAYDLVADYDLPEQHLTILKELGAAQSQTGDLDAARSTYRAALERAQSLNDTQTGGGIELALGDIAYRQSRWQEALEHYASAERELGEMPPDKLRSIQLKQAEAYARLGDLLYSEGQWAQAEQAFQAALDRELLAGRTDRDAELLYRLGMSAAAQEQWAEAVSYFERSLASLTGDEIGQRDRTLAQLAFALQQQGKQAQAEGDWAAAGQLFDRAIRMAQASYHYDQLADLWLRRGDVYAAQERWLAASNAYRRGGEYDRAYGDSVRCRELDQKNAYVLVREGQAALNAGDAKGARDLFHEALDLATAHQELGIAGLALGGLGQAAEQNGDWNRALELYAQAGQHLASVEDTDHWRTVSAREIELLRAVAARHAAQGHDAEAEHAYRRALSLAQSADVHQHDGELLYGLGRVLSQQEQWDEAVLTFDLAEPLYDAPTTHARADFQLAQARALEEAGALAQRQEHWAEAQGALQRAADIWQVLGERQHAGLAWQRLGQIAAAQEQWNDAARCNEQALAFLESPETAAARQEVLEHQARILANIGAQQRAAGDLQGAQETYRAAIVIARERGDLETIASMYSALGSAYETQELWNQALVEHRHALEVYEELNRTEQQASTWMRLGEIQRLIQEYAGAEKAFENAHARFVESGDRAGQGLALHRLGLVRSDQGEFDDALARYNQALVLYNQIDARAAKAEIYRSIEQAVQGAKRGAAADVMRAGDAFSDSGEWTRAESAYREAQGLYEQVGAALFAAQAQNKLGSALEAQMRWDEALVEYQQALARTQEQGDVDLEITLLTNLGNVYREQRKWVESESAYRQALALDPETANAARAGELYAALGLVREAQEDWEGALEYYNQAQALLRPADPAYAQLETNLERAERGARRKAIAQAKRELDAAREAGSLAEQGELLNSLGLMLAEDQNWNQALAYYQQAIQVFDRLAAEEQDEPLWRTAQGTIYYNIAEAQQNLGAWSDAEAALARALGVAQEVGDSASEATLLASLGVTAERQAELRRALDLNVQALEKFRALGEETPLPELLERIGNLQLELEQVDAADSTFQQALSAASSARDTERAARLHTQLAHLAEGRGDSEQALEHYARALDLNVELERLAEQKRLLKRQSDLLMLAERWDEAEQADRRALELAEAQGDEILQAELYLRLGNAVRRRGDLQGALAFYDAALPLYDKQGARRVTAQVQSLRGDVHSDLGERDSAREAYQAALALAQEEDLKAARIVLWRKLAGLEAQANRWNEAAALLAQAQDTLGQSGDPQTRLALAQEHGDAAWHSGDWTTAGEKFELALELAQQTGDRAREGWLLNRLGLLAQAQRQWDDALHTFQEAIENLREQDQPLGEAQVLNNIARLKLETGATTEADLFAQAALAVAQTLGSSEEQSRALYTRGLVALDSQALGTAARYFTQAVVANPGNWAAQLQLGNALAAAGQGLATRQQAEAGLGQGGEWELGAQAQLAITALSEQDPKVFRQQLKQTRALLAAAENQGTLAPGFVRAVEALVRALEGDADAALAGLDELNQLPARPETLDAYRFLRGALYALAHSARRFRGKPTLVAHFALPKLQQAQPRRRSKRHSTDEARPQAEQTGRDAVKPDEGAHPATEPPPDESTLLDEL